MGTQLQESSKSVVARYFEMWNSGDTSAATEILSRDWVDHAHPEVTGPDGVRQAVLRTRAARPDLRFHVESMLTDGDQVVVVGGVGEGSAAAAAAEPASRFVWRVRVEDGRMTQLWTYRMTSA
ncbi:ester cyclase [Dactylosporangium sp. NBC_01737]|uniref:nuclear transport factor 2 family protein n=1 Tax=Dactylosporangium sp. NBC_01737 TaxID=2975959 RepID=UPI002E13E946|nr:ester cyclase [Dactylosporangium sp. NBC_01737]